MYLSHKISFICVFNVNYSLFRAAKEQKKSTKAAKKAAAPPKPKNVSKTKAAKNVQKAAPRVGGKR